MARQPDDTSVDHLFGLFRTTGRPRYLAEVFDRTAPELLRVALHTARDPAEAEDLVQSTFVEAIRHARRFDSGRRVLPWLVGMLGNLCKESHRRRRRQPDRGRIERRAAVDPVTAAAGAELDSALETALSETPEPYRQVLVLHLRHGLAPAAIADALGRPPATVRSQLARGLDKLRRVLPASFAGAGALWLSAGRGLAAVRRAVVWRAGCAAPGLLLAALAGRVAAAPLAATLAAGVLVAALALAFAAGRGAGGGGGHEEPRGERVATSASPAAAAAATAADPGAAASRRALAPAAATGAIAVNVRCAPGEDPSGIAVAAAPRHLPDPMLRVVTTTTDATGAARIDVPTPGAWSVWLDRAPAVVVEVEPGQGARADFDLRRHATVRGRVATARGEPVPGAALWLAPPQQPDAGMALARADERGRFALVGLPPGWYVAPIADGYRPTEPVPAPAGGELRLALDAPAASVRGRVVDEAGRGVPGALVCVGGAFQPFVLLDPEGAGERAVANRWPVVVRTGPGGEFATASAEPGSKLPVFARAADRVGASARVAVAPGGSASLELVLPRGGAISGRAGDGPVPLADVVVGCGARRLGEPTWLAPVGRTDRTGRYLLTGVAPGAAAVTAYTRASGAARREVPVARGQTAALDFPFDAVAAIRGRAVDERGAPVAGLEVVLGEGRSSAVVTDGAGAFRIAVPESMPSRLALYDPRGAVRAPVFARAVAAGEPELHVVVGPDRRPTATLRGAARLPDGSAAATGEVRIRAEGEPLWAAFPLDRATGGFAVGPLVAGRYDVRVVAGDHPPHDPGPIVVGAGEGRDLGAIVLEPGARIALAVTDDRGPVGGARLHVRVRDEVGTPRYARDLVAGDHVTEGVPAGRHLVTVWGDRLPIVTVAVEVPRAGVVAAEIHAGAWVEQRIVIAVPEPAPLRGEVPVALEWSDAHGAPLAADDLLMSGPPPWSLARPLLPGRYRLRVRAHGFAPAAIDVVAGAADSPPLRVQLAR